MQYYSSSSETATPSAAATTIHHPLSITRCRNRLETKDSARAHGADGHQRKEASYVLRCITRSRPSDIQVYPGTAAPATSTIHQNKELHVTSCTSQRFDDQSSSALSRADLRRMEPAVVSWGSSDDPSDAWRLYLDLATVRSSLEQHFRLRVPA